MSSSDEAASSSRSKPSSSSTMTSTVSQSAHTVYQWITAIAWEIYKPLLSGPTEMLVPEHTRDAFFQLWCDLRTNVPKDRKWLTRHALALKPQTLPGWIALSSAALFASAGSTAFLSMSLAIFAVITYTLVTVVTVSGLAIGFSLLVISAASIVAALVTGWFAMCAAAAYAFVASVVAVFSYGLKVFKGTPLGQAQGKKPKPKTGNKLVETPNATSLAELNESIARSSEEDRIDEAKRVSASQASKATHFPTWGENEFSNEAQRASASQASKATELPPSFRGENQFNDGIRAWKEGQTDKEPPVAPAFATPEQEPFPPKPAGESAPPKDEQAAEALPPPPTADRIDKVPHNGRSGHNSSVEKEKVAADASYKQPGAQTPVQGNGTGDSAILKEKIATSPLKMESGSS